MSSNIEHLGFLNFINSFYEGGTRWALINDKSEIVACRVSLASDITSLGQSVKTLRSYVQLNDGDIYVTNQIQITQSHALDFLLVQCIKLGNQNFYLTEMTSAAAFTTANETVFPLPPFPLYLNSEDHTEVLEQMKQAYGEEFFFAVRESIHRQLLGRLRLFEYSEFFPQHFSSAFVARTLRITYETATHLLEDIRLGEHSAQLAFSGLGVLSLTLKKEDDHLVADFSKSKTASEFQIFATDFRDIVAQAFSILSGFEIPINEGLLGLFDVKAPKSSPSSTGIRSRSQLLALPCFSELFFHTLRKLYMHDIGALNAPGALTVKLGFQNSTFKHIFLGGGGAKIQTHGEMGRCPWLKDFSLTSLENIEAQNPIQFEYVGPSPQTGGRGIKNGGEGISWDFKVESVASVEIESIQLTHRAEGYNGGKSGEPAHINDHQSETFMYNFTLKPQQLLQIVTGGGGGFGELNSEN